MTLPATANRTFIHMPVLSYFRVMSARNVSMLLMLAVLMLLPGCRTKQAATSAAKSVKRKKMLVAVEVKSIQLTTMPRYGRDGEAWDAYAPFATDPDPFVRILWNENELYLSEVKDNQPHGTVITFEQALPLKLVPFDQPLIIELFDDDGITSDDNVGYFTFTPADFRGKDVIVLSQGELSISLSMAWYYE